MERYSKYREIEMAGGPPLPLWPVKDQANRKVATFSFGGGRPFNCKSEACVRWHAGIDLRCPANSIVILPELCTIEAVDRGWSGKAKAVFARSASGLFLVFGGTIRGSGAEWSVKEGSELEAGHPIGRVQPGYGMVHFETYKDDAYRMGNSRWYIGKPPPEGLLNPLNYLERAAGLEESIQSYSQIRNTLTRLGFHPASSGPWGDEDIDALIEAQEKYGLEQDGLWGPQSESRLRDALKKFPETDQEPETVPPDVPPEVTEPETVPPEASSRTGTRSPWMIGLVAASAVGGFLWWKRNKQ